MDVEVIERQGEVQQSMLADATTEQLPERLDWTVQPQVNKSLAVCTHTHASHLHEHGSVKL